MVGKQIHDTPLQSVSRVLTSRKSTPSLLLFIYCYVATFGVLRLESRRSGGIVKGFLSFRAQAHCFPEQRMLRCFQNSTRTRFTLAVLQFPSR
jgi:hypothetical protein